MRALLMAVCLAWGTPGMAGDWPSWRGPHGNGVADGATYPLEWSKEKNIAWQLTMTGSAGSTPVVLGDLIVLTCSEGGKNSVWGISSSGEILWKTTVGDEKPGKHKKGSGCNPSPVSDGERVFVYFKSGDFAAIDRQGKTLWHKNLQTEYGPDTLWWDLGTSPVLTQEHVVVTVMQSGPSPSYLAAFHRATGQVAWKVDRELGAPEEAAQSYSTPAVTTFEGQETLLTIGADFATAHSAKDGKEFWRVGSLNAEQNKYYRSIASGVADAGIYVAPYGRGEMLYGIKLGGTGDVTKSHVVWSRKGLSADVPTPVALNGRAYVLTDKGKVGCLQVGTGEIVWEGELEKNRNAYSASPILAGGHLYLVREDGTAFVLKSGDTYELVSKNELGGTVIATPVFVNGKILLRTFETLYCIAAQ
ncbi:MAG: hypothetical protein DWH91_18320 [Planctomycetota bacterium]|nr:MAG: hypothetical protein DWH91_18320 [Planctomycetota bacterium]